MTYLLRRTEDSKFVTPAGSSKSYTDSVRKARKFDTREDAEREACGNERAITLEEACT